MKRPTNTVARVSVLLAVMLTACVEPSPDADPSSTVARATETPSSAAALAYVADRSATGLRISAAQANVRAHPRDAAAHVELAMLLMRRQRETSDAALMRYAEQVLATARALDPEDATATLLTAMTLQDAHRFEPAAAMAREVLAKDPRNATAHLVLADAQLELGRYDAAMDSVQAAVDIHPDLRSYNRAAHLRWLAGDFDSALAIMELAIDSGSPRDPEAIAWCFTDLGMMFLHRGDAARAQASAERALSLVPDYLPGISLRARARARAGDTREAIALLDRVLERRPSVEDLLTVAEWHEAIGDLDAAAARRADADRLADDDPRPMALDLARRDVQTDRALSLAERALEQRADIATHDALALALARSGRDVAAQEHLQAALALGTADARLHLHAALVHALAGRIVEARAAQARAEAIDPEADLRLSAELRRRLGAA